MVSLKRAWPAVVAMAVPFAPAWADPGTPPDSTQQWRNQMERVGEFPRGHADIVRWERQHLPGATPDAAPDQPLTEADAVRMALGQHPALITAAGPEPAAERERHLAQLALAAQARRAWIDAVLAGEALRVQQARTEVAESGAELGRRMVEAGNWSAARGLNEQITQARERVALLQARQAERSAREALARVIGVADAKDVAALARRLPAQVPALPAVAAESTPSDPEALVLQADTALAMQRNSTTRQLAAVSGERLTQARQVRTQALASLPPPGWPVTRIDLADPRTARDQPLADALDAEAALQRTTVERRSQAREAWSRLLSQHALAQQAQSALLPLLATQEQETQRRYNGMLQSTWELLEATRERLAATGAAAEARHGYWSALIDWQLLSAGAPTKEH